MAAEVTVDVIIRGYHVYRDIWSVVVDEQHTRSFQHYRFAVVGPSGKIAKSLHHVKISRYVVACTLGMYSVSDE